MSKDFISKLDKHKDFVSYWSIYVAQQINAVSMLASLQMLLLLIEGLLYRVLES
jgi:hypothetical protein